MGEKEMQVGGSSPKPRLSPATRLEVKRFVEKWKPHIEDPSLLDEPLRTMLRFVKKMAEEEGPWRE